MNDNCLAGKACPQCGSEEPFAIAVTALATVWDSGPDDFKQVEWEDYTACRCCQCGFFGTVSDFTLLEPGLEVEDDRDPAVVDFCFPPVNPGVRGGPCLRSSSVPAGVAMDETFDIKVVAAKWVDYDYDDGGAYWGAMGDRVWCGYDMQRRIRVYVRAETEQEAKDEVEVLLLRYLATGSWT